MRFECPRCQTIFTHTGDDDAFVECPSCGALAMSAGDATGVDSDALARTLSSTHDVSSFQSDEGTPAKNASNASGSNGSDDGDSDDDQRPEDSERSLRPQSGQSGPGLFADLLAGTVLGDDRADPPPPIHTAPQFGAGARAAADDEDSVRQTRPSLDEKTAERSETGSAEGSIDLGLDEELGDFDLPSTKPGAKALSPSTKTPLRKKAHEEARPPPPPPPPEVAASLSDDAMGALEAAFDTLAAAPPQRLADGLTEDERLFLEGMAGAQPPPPAPTAAPRRAPPRPPQKPGVPRAAPPPLRKKSSAERPPLSDQAIDAAFIRLRRVPTSIPGDGIEGLPPPPPRREATVDPEITSPGHHAPVRPAAAAAKTKGAEGETPRRKPVIVREKPTVFVGLSKGLVAAGVMVGLLAGGAVGAATAPSQVKRNDGRARAELAVADGNRYYEVARYDDALGKYKNAINNDRSYAPAHKAKGAALAKQAQTAAQTQQNDSAQRLWDEAADAYREYLALEPSAIDGGDIKQAIGRRGLEPVSTGPGGSDG